MKSRVLHSFIIICILLCSVLQALTQKMNKKVRILSFLILLVLFNRNIYWILIYAFITNCSSCYSLSFLVKFWGWDLPQTKLNCQKWKYFQMGCIIALCERDKNDLNIVAETCIYLICIPFLYPCSIDISYTIISS